MQIFFVLFDLAHGQDALDVHTWTFFIEIIKRSSVNIAETCCTECLDSFKHPKCLDRGHSGDDPSVARCFSI